MSIIYTDQWYADMKAMVNGSPKFREMAPREKILATFEIIGDEQSPYVTNGNALYYLIRLEGGMVAEYGPLSARHDGKGLNFRFTAPAALWEGIAAGLVDPIQAGLRGTIKVRGDMRFLMQHAEAVKLLVDMYGHQVSTEWPQGKPPYGSRTAAA